MAKANWIMLYADEFNTDTWKDFCDVCRVPYSTTEIKIYFNDEDVEYEDEEI